MHSWRSLWDCGLEKLFYFRPGMMPPFSVPDYVLPRPKILWENGEYFQICFKVLSYTPNKQKQLKINNVLFPDGLWQIALKNWTEVRQKYSPYCLVKNSHVGIWMFPIKPVKPSIRLRFVGPLRPEGSESARYTAKPNNLLTAIEVASVIKRGGLARAG